MIGVPRKAIYHRPAKRQELRGSQGNWHRMVRLRLAHCGRIIQRSGSSPGAALFNVYLKGNGAGMGSVCLANRGWQSSVVMLEVKQRTSISVATPLPGLMHLAVILLNLVRLPHPGAGSKGTPSGPWPSFILSPGLTFLV